MHKQWIKIGVGGLMAIIFLLINVSASRSVQAATLADGTYSVPASFVKDANGSASSTPSSAAGYFGSSATVIIKDGHYQATLPITTIGQKYITGTTVNGASALSGASLAFTLTEPATTVPVTFDLTTPMGKMTQSAWMTLDWSGVPAATVPETGSSSDQTSSSSSSTITANHDSANSNRDDSNSSSTVNSTTSSSSSSSAVTKPTTSTTATTKAATTTSADPLTGWTYEVLQADKNVASAANKFYTHVAQITKSGTGYQVLLTVKYSKTSGMTEHGFTPLTINGQTAQNIHYSTNGNYYVATYTFTIKSLSDLASLINGTVHVTVPTAGVDQTFTVRFKFSHTAGNTTNDAADTATAKPTTSRHGSTTSQTAKIRSSKSRLPQTNETKKSLHLILAGVVGLLGLGSGVIIMKKVW